MRYNLGIDGGGTKTEFCLTDEKRNIITRFILGASNPNDIGFEGTKEVLTRGIDLALTGNENKEAAVYAGISGCRTGNYNAMLRDFLSSAGFAFYACGSDIDLSLDACLADNDGIAVIMGTGQCVITRQNNVVSFKGGYGYLIDKAGSGFDIGADVLSNAALAEDGAAPYTLLIDLIKNKTSEKSVRASLGSIYKTGKSAVASFAPLCFEAYKSGDKVSEDILNRNISRIAALINASLISFKKDEKVPVVICGGLTAHSDVILPFLDKLMKSFGCNNDITVCKENMSYHAAVMASELR